MGLDVAGAAHAQGEDIETDVSLAEGADEPSGFVLRNAFAAPGLLHIVHNMRASMHTVYLDWEAFWNRFENLEAVLAKQRRRQRSVGTCIVDASAVGLVGRLSADEQAQLDLVCEALGLRC